MATILIDKNVMVSMRDGVRLATDVYRLDGAPPALVLLARTPYDKEHIVVASNTFDILRAVQAGYVVVVQECAGGLPPRASSTRSSNDPPRLKAKVFHQKASVAFPRVIHLCTLFEDPRRDTKECFFASLRLLSRGRLHF